MISGIVIDSSTNKPLKCVKLTSSNGDNPVTSTTDVTSEFKDDVVEVMIDEAASILAGDMEIFTQYQREQQRVEQNN